MEWLAVLFLFSSSFVFSQQKTCFEDAADILSEYDSLLSGRLINKNLYIFMKKDEESFVELMSEFASNGTDYFTQGTSDWLSEILVGLKAQYRNAGRDSFVEPPAGKNGLIEFFRKSQGSIGRLYYRLKFVGAFPREWFIEKLPGNQGYRIYQSGDDAFSLKAWLTTNRNQFYEDEFWRSRHLIVWEKNRKRIEQILKKSGHSFRDLSQIPSIIRPYMKYVRDYNQEETRNNFKKAWSVFGGGIILSSDQFETQYLRLLYNVTSEMQTYFQNVNKLWTEEIFIDWIKLFGTPNHYCYPQVPYNAAQTDSLPKDLRLKIQTYNDPGSERSSQNAYILAKSVKRSTHDICSGANPHPHSLLLAMILSPLVLLSITL